MCVSVIKHRKIKINKKITAETKDPKEYDFETPNKMWMFKNVVAKFRKTVSLCLCFIGCLYVCRIVRSTCKGALSPSLSLGFVYPG